jgi:hypothetical protein
MGRTASEAFADHQLSKTPRSPGWAAGLGSCAPGSASASLPLHDDRGRSVPGAERAAGAVRQCQIAILDLHRGMRLAAQSTRNVTENIELSSNEASGLPR